MSGLPTKADEFATQAHGPALTDAVVSAAWPNLPGYQIVDKIGRGGMGVVYRARQVKANREVAVKMIVSGECADPAEIARFRIEAEAVAQLQHPNIVAVFEVGEHSGLPFFSMEFCSEGTLASFASKGPLSPHEACSILLPIARGAAVAHAAGIVHRDLKPQNVLRAADGTFKISDFGLAKRVVPGDSERSSGLTHTGAVLGTPSYMAPEQAFGDSKHVGPEADVYALGAMLYTLLVGRPPFVGPTPMDTMLKVVTEEPESLRNLRSEIPYELEVVCLKCLEKDRHKRYRTAAELADDLACFLDGEPISAVRSGFVGRMVGAIDRVQLQEKFASYGSILLVLAPIMFVPEVLVTFVTWNGGPTFLLPLAQFGRVAAFVATVRIFRHGRWLPNGPVERHLWVVWFGYLLCCFGIGFSTRLATDLFAASVELNLYQSFAVLAALAFFALTTSYWGYCALIALAFLALTFVMAIDLRFAPLEYGSLWAAVLVFLGLRLRGLSKVESAESSRS